MSGLEFTFQAHEATTVKTLLKQHGISRLLLSRIKFQGGALTVNGEEVTVKYPLYPNDTVTVTLPPEGTQPKILATPGPLDILFEDAHFLVLNKPWGMTTQPVRDYDDQSLANRVKAYYQRQGYENQVIHPITRLDRDTSGVTLFARHSYAHGLFAKLMAAGAVTKEYLAWTDQPLPETDGLIELPIGRHEGSIIEREVRADGKAAKTEYHLVRSAPGKYLYRVKLHTGRTHQIRVHFAALGAPLIGDALYGGSQTTPIKRQALHCARLAFTHPITGVPLDLRAPVPADLAAYFPVDGDDEDVSGN